MGSTTGYYDSMTPPGERRFLTIRRFAKTSYSRLLDLIAILAELLDWTSWAWGLGWFMRFVLLTGSHCDDDFFYSLQFVGFLFSFGLSLGEGRRLNIQSILTYSTII